MVINFYRNKFLGAGHWFGAITRSGSRALWFVYRIFIKFLYSNKSPLYRSDLLSIGVTFTAMGISFVIAAFGISYYSDTSSSSGETIPTQVSTNSSKVVGTPSGKSTLFDNPPFKAPPENTKLYYAYYGFVYLGVGFLLVGTFFLTADLSGQTTLFGIGEKSHIPDWHHHFTPSSTTLGKIDKSSISYDDIIDTSSLYEQPLIPSEKSNPKPPI